MNGSIRQGKLDAAVSTILQAQDEERCWSLYLSTIQNPFIDSVGSFDDFVKKYGTYSSGSAKKSKKDSGMSEAQVQAQVQKAEMMLKGFVPPEND